MAPELEGFLSELERAEARDDLHSVVLALRKRYGIDHVVYHWVSSDGEQYGFGSYPLDWVNRYVERDYLRVDPVILGAFQRFHPVDWKRLDWSSRPARAFRKDAMEHGIGNQGYSIPIRGPQGQFALLSLSHNCDDDEWEAFTAEHRRELILIAHLLNEKALELESGRRPEPIRNLSPRELDTLTFLAMGYSRGQIADTLAISEHTLRAYIESARHKLSAVNTIHAVARAQAEGLIIVGGAARAAPGGWPGREDATAAE